MTTLAKTTQNPLVRALHSSGLLAEDLDYHVVRASMVIMFLFFGYQKWFLMSSKDWSRSSATGR